MSKGSSNVNKFLSYVMKSFFIEGTYHFLGSRMRGGKGNAGEGLGLGAFLGLGGGHSERREGCG